MNFVAFNGKYYGADEPLLLASNKSYRYGDGLFETLRVAGGKILLEPLHFDRLYSSLTRLGMVLPKLLTRERLRMIILDLARKNKAEKLGRVRLSFFRGNGGILEGDDEVSYVAEAWPLDPSINEFNSNGLVVGLFPHARKMADAFSAVKTASFLPYSLAARFAKKQQWNDSLLLNQYGRPCDTSIANIFLVKDNRMSTPALTEGCIDGVMRRHLFQVAADNGLILEERELEMDDLYAADEVFLSNSIRGIKWVGSLEGHIYGSHFSGALHTMVNLSLGL
ncbi:MAG: hypothetical protein EOO09_03870 [Chitinophagaceae bacterium]|nr:MAG: hypothetical protein EOO09_03870 [Chitinophagaceae bacterium]